MRETSVERCTKETQICMKLCFDGSGKADINTGIGFLDHMLTSFARHGFFDLQLKATGDLHVDCHHTVEDVGIVLGQAIGQLLEDKSGIKRYGQSCIPMDEALVLCAIDISGRAFLRYNVEFPEERVGSMDTCMFREFFQAVASNAGITLHIKQLDGYNSHHIAEAMFKAFSRALREAVTIDSEINGILSTKGTL